MSHSMAQHGTLIHFAAMHLANHTALSECPMRFHFIQSST